MPLHLRRWDCKASGPNSILQTLSAKARRSDRSNATSLMDSVYDMSASSDFFPATQVSKIDRSLG
jgi:hypothetical protein